MDELNPHQVTLCDPFWSPPQEINARRAIFHQWEQLEASGCIDNFRIAAGEKVAFREGWFFADSDAHKWLDAAVRIYTHYPDPQLAGVADQVYYLLADHLGSTTVSYRSDGQETRTQSYKPWGELRPGPGTSLPTDRTYTGQSWEEVELHYFNARWYDGALGRFAQADSIVPDGVQGLDRYAFVNNNPLKYIDPSGNNPECGPDGMYCNVHITRPSKSCTGDCWDSYMTYKNVVKKLEYVVSVRDKWW